MITEAQTIKIDESVKVSSWGAQNNNQDPARQHFQKYAQTPTLHQHAEDEPEEAHLGLQTGFRRLKNEQIEKLKDLRTEYEEIRKIGTDYAAPRDSSRTPSLQSSSRAQSQPPAPAGKVAGREVQILELEKKQLEIMVENSMKKIEELLHNEMAYKKTIHELRLTRQARTSADLDPESLTRLLKKKEREFQERLKLLELEREALAGSLAGARDRVKYLQGSLSASEQELRRLLDEKRNTEEQLRLQKDRFLSLEIELRRERRQHQISEKDKTAEINRLLKLRDMRESASERQLRNSLAALQEEVKVKDERYHILLEKFEGYQREQRERQDQKQKQSQARAVNELLSRSSSPDPQSRLLQQTITGILTRLTDLEKKPIVQIDNIVNHEHEEHSEIVQRLELKISQLSKLHQEKAQQVSDLEAQNYQLKTHQEKLERDITRLTEREQESTQQLERLKKLERTFRKDKSSAFPDLRPRTELPTNSTPAPDTARLLEGRVATLTRENQVLIGERKALEEENRELRLSISRLEFEVEKAAKEKSFSLSLQEKAYEKRLEDLSTALSELKAQNSQLTADHQRAAQQAAHALSLKTEEANQLRQALEALQRERNNLDALLKENVNSSVGRLRAENSLKLTELTSAIQQLTVENQRLREEREEWAVTVLENQQLAEMLKRTRFINAECDRLWNSKEEEYEKIHRILTLIPQ